MDNNQSNKQDSSTKPQVKNHQTEENEYKDLQRARGQDNYFCKECEFVNPTFWQLIKIKIHTVGGMIINYMFPLKDNEQKRVKKKEFQFLSVYPAFILITSLLCMSISWYLELAMKGHAIELFELIHELFLEIGKALFVVATISTLIEVVHYRQYFAHRLEEVIFGENYLRRLGRERLEMLLKSIECRLYNGDQRTDPEGFYQKVRREISDLSAKCYFDYFELTIEVSRETINNIDLYKKNIRRNIVLVNPTSKCIKENLNFGAYMLPLPGLEKEQYKILFVKVDDKDMTEKLAINRSTLADTDYSVDINCSHTLHLQPGERRSVESVIETLVPAHDCHYWHRIQKPCKEYRVRCYITDEKYTVDGTGFGFLHGFGLKYFGRIRQKEANGVTIHFRDWILPGDGVTLTITDREQGQCR